MSEWKEYLLGDLLSLKPEYGANAAGINYRPQLPRFLRITDIDDNGRLIKTDLVSVDIKYLEQYGLKQDDIVIARTGNTVGKSYLYNEKDGTLVYAGYLIKFRFDGGKVLPQFAFHHLQSERFKSWIKNTVRIGAQPNINAAEYCSIKFKFPPLPEQRRIARILSTADAVIEKTQAAIAKYQAIKQGMLQDVFTRGIDTTTGALRPRYDDAPHLYKESALGWIPKEWEADCLGSIIDAVDPQPDHRTPHSVENGVPYLGINDMDKYGNIDLTKCRKVSDEILAEHKKRYTIRMGDIMFGKIGTIGEPKRLLNFDNITLSANVILIQPKCVADYIYWLLCSQLINGQVKKSIHATSQPAFGIEKIRALIVPICDEIEQSLISQAINSCDTKLRTEQAYLEKLQALKKGLMEDLLTGKVRVVAVEELAAQK